MAGIQQRERGEFCRIGHVRCRVHWPRQLPHQHAVEGLGTIARNGSDHQGCVHLAGHLRDDRGSIGVPKWVHVGGVFRPDDDINILPVQRLRYSVVIGEVVSPVVIGKQTGLGIALHGQDSDRT